MRRLTWVFLVHDLNLWFAKELDKKLVMRLKNWAGLYRGSDTGALFRRRDHLGLQLTSLEEHYQRMQLVKCCLLANSKDNTVRAVYEAKKQREEGFKNRWSGTKELSNLEPIVEHATRFAGQTGRSGLGWNLSNPYIANPTVAEHRSKVTSTLADQCEEDRVRHASCLVRQGVWTHWDNVRPFDLSWHNLIYGPGPRVIAFVLNAQINSVRTPDMLKLWGYTNSAACVLCNADQCTLHHLLANCPFALNQGRYTWRHDSVLQDIERALLTLVPAFNSKKPSCFAEIAKKDFKASFVRAGERRKPKANNSQKRRCLLEFANDWKLQVDFKDRKLVFPPAICPTALRPDGVLWSPLSRTVILLELTCPAEEGIEAAQIRKEARYAGLTAEITEQKWTPTLLTIEVGARGLVGSRTFRSFVTLGFSVQSANQLCKSLSDIVSRCSYAIYLAHSTPVWSHNSDLVECRSSVPTLGDETALSVQKETSQKLVPNIVTLKRNGIEKLYHFTDAANLPSIEKHGLMSASNLVESGIASTMNSNDLSRSVDESTNLENFVRLSFCPNNPMMYVAYNEGRVSQPVRLEIKLEAVSRPGVRFTDCNAIRADARHSTNPSIVRFDVVRAKTVFDVAVDLQRFYQAEVLVPSPLPRHLIIIPSKAVKMPPKKKPASRGNELKSAAAEGGDLSVSEPTIAESAVVCEARRSSKSSSTSMSFSTTSASTTASNVSLAEGEAATSLTSHAMVRSALESSETRLFAKFIVSADASASVNVPNSSAPAKVFARSPAVSPPEKRDAYISRRVRDAPWTSTLLGEMQQERKARLLNLCKQLRCDLKKSTAMLRQPSPVERHQLRCQMPLSRSATCTDGTLTFFNCPRHMLQCGAQVWGCCPNKECLRALCYDHLDCYCETERLRRVAQPTKPYVSVPTAVAASPNAPVMTARKPVVPAVEDAMLAFLSASATNVALLRSPLSLLRKTQ